MTGFDIYVQASSRLNNPIYTKRKMIYQRQHLDIKGDIMTENKQVQIIIRTTQEEKHNHTKAKIKVFL